MIDIEELDGFEIPEKRRIYKENSKRQDNISLSDSHHSI